MKLYITIIAIVLILLVIQYAGATEMTATVNQSEMRSCIETCGYQFK